MTKEFERGREYERKNTDLHFHLFLGWACLGFGLFFWFSVWDFYTKLKTSIALLLFGGISLYLGYSEKKKLKKYDNRKSDDEM